MLLVRAWAARASNEVSSAVDDDGTVAIECRSERRKRFSEFRARGNKKIAIRERERERERVEKRDLFVEEGKSL